MGEFFWRAWLGGLGIALICAPLGTVMVWRRMAYFGDTLSHGALLGVALAILFQVHMMLGVAVTSVFIGLLLKQLLKQTKVPTDALLGVLSHTTLAIGLIAVTVLPGPRIAITTLLMGDILSLSWSEVVAIWGAGAVAILLFVRLYPTLLASTIDEGMAQVEGHPVKQADAAFILLLALLVALALKVVGALLITALLIIPAATARQAARSPEQMIGLAAGVGVLSVTGGLWSSMWVDIPTGPAMVCWCAGMFFLSVLMSNFIKPAVRNGNP